MIVIISVLVGMAFVSQEAQGNDAAWTVMTRPEGSCTVTYYQASTGITYTATAPTCLEAKKMILAAL